MVYHITKFLVTKFLAVVLASIVLSLGICGYDLNAREQDSKGILLNETRAAITVAVPVAQTYLISSLDIRPGIDGMRKTIRDVVLDQLMVCESEKLPMPLPENPSEAYLAGWQQQFKMTRQEIFDYFNKQLGYSEDDLKVELKKRALIDRLIDYKVRTHKDMFIAQEDIEKYWREHPQIEEAFFTLSETFVPSSESLKTFTKKFKEHPDSYAPLWGEPFRVYVKDLPIDKLFVGNCNAGDIALIEPAKGGFQVTKLVQKKEETTVALQTGDAKRDEQVKREVTEKLKTERFLKIMKEFQHELLQEYKPRITFMHEEDRQELYEE